MNDIPIIKGKTILEIEKLNNIGEVFYFTDGSKLVIEAEDFDDGELTFTFSNSSSHVDELKQKLIDLDKRIAGLIKEEDNLSELLSTIEK